MRAASEYVQYDENEDLPLRLQSAAISLPVLVGVEAEGVRAAEAEASGAHTAGSERRSLCRRKPVEPAETGRPETSHEFAKRAHKLVFSRPS